MSEFHKDIDDYISSRRKRSSLFSMKEESVRLHPESDQPYPEPEPEVMVEPELSEPVDVVESVEPKEGFFSRIFKKKEEPVIEPPNELIRDLKIVSKIALSIAKQLPPDKLEDLKRSDQYAQFKEILKKHGLIK